MKSLLILLAIPLIISPLSSLSGKTLVMRIDGPITEGVVAYMEEVISIARQKGINRVVVVLDTNGGFLSATERIVDLMRNSGVEFAVYVPPGGRAFSAGSIILLASKVAGMGPGAVVGAAQPRPYDEKVVSAIAGWAKSLAESSNRNSTAAERFVRDNLALSDKEALRCHVIEFEAHTLEEFLQDVGWTGYVQEVSPDLRSSVLLIVTNPDDAWLLLMIGALMILLGLTHPTYIVEIVGAALVLLGLLGMDLIGVSMTAFVIIVLGVVAMFLELKTGHGVLAIIGACISALGLVMIYESAPMLPMSVWSEVMAGLLVCASGLLGFYLYKMRAALKMRPVVHTLRSLVGKEGVVKRRIPAGGEGVVLVESELWTATSDEDLEEGEKILVLDVRGMRLVVARCE